MAVSVSANKTAVNIGEIISLDVRPAYGVYQHRPPAPKGMKGPR